VILLNIPLSVSGLVAVMVLLYTLATLSRRLGAVTKMKPYYRGFYVAMIAVAVAIGAAVLRRPQDDLSLFLAAYYLPLIVAGVISLVVTYRYWGWLFRERMK
jgi:hypothetical protein